MKNRMLSLLAMLAVGVFATSAAACPDHDHNHGHKAKKVVQAADAKAQSTEAKAPCGSKKVETVAADAKKPCGSAKGVETVADATKPCAGKKAETVAEGKKPCCGSKKAQTVADGSKPCAGKKAETVATGTSPCGKNCSGDCANCPHCSKSATLTAGKTEGAKPCNKPCGKSATTASAGGCPIGKKVETVLASMPAMKYRVGEDTFCCSKTAAAKAAEANTSMKYVVGSETFEKESDAVARLVAVLEEEVGNLNSVQYAVGDKSVKCPMTARGLAEQSKSKVAYRVGGIDFSEKDQAEKAHQLVSENLASVKMSYKVGDKSFCCDKMATMAAKDSKATMIFVVGDEEVHCPLAAKLTLTQAKIRKIVETAAAASLAS